MNTAQESPNGPHVSPPPCPVENPAELHSAHLPADQDHNNQFPAGAYHVPPNIYVPKAYAYRNDDHVNRPHLDGPLPQRCQFMFSDGRQCTMARSDIHPSLCPYHSEREEQLFGEPSAKGLLRGPSFDLPELFTASGDLTTAAGVNRALGQVFRLFAQRRISRQEAATFAKLAQLLLQSIRAAQAEALDASLSDDLGGGVILPSGESHGHQELSPANIVRSERRISPEFSSPQELSPLNQSARRGDATIPSEGRLSESARTAEPRDLSVPLPASADSSKPPIAASPGAATQHAAMSNPPRISTSVPSVRNSPEISTYKNAGLQPVQNEHLQKNGNGV